MIMQVAVIAVASVAMAAAFIGIARMNDLPTAIKLKQASL